MKINIACPSTGGQKVFDIDDEKKLRVFMELRISDEVDVTPLGDEFKGYVLRIVGGSDKDGFPMKQGVLVNHRVRLLLKPGSVGYRRGKRDGVRRRRTVRGCIVANDLSVLNTVVVKKGEQEIPGLTDKVVPRRVGPKRASKIRKLFNLSKKDNVLKYLITRTRPNKKEGGKPHVRGPKVQRLVTSRTLMHRRRYRKELRERRLRARREAAEYKEMLKRHARRAAAKKRVHRHKKVVRKADPKREHLKRMLLLQRAIAEKRAEKYRQKQRHLAGVKAAQKRAAERKEAEKNMTPKQIEAQKRAIRAFHRRLRIQDAVRRQQQVRHAQRVYNRTKAEAARLSNVVKKLKFGKKTTARLQHELRKAQQATAQLPKIVRIEQIKQKCREERRKKAESAKAAKAAQKAAPAAAKKGGKQQQPQGKGAKKAQPPAKKQAVAKKPQQKQQKPAAKAQPKKK